MSNRLPCDKCIKKSKTPGYKCLVRLMLPKDINTCPYFEPFAGD